MTRRIQPRSAIAAGDPVLARSATIDLADTTRVPSGIGRIRSLGELARSLVPASIVPAVREEAAFDNALPDPAE